MNYETGLTRRARLDVSLPYRKRPMLYAILCYNSEDVVFSW